MHLSSMSTARCLNDAKPDFAELPGVIADLASGALPSLCRAISYWDGNLGGGSEPSPPPAS